MSKCPVFQLIRAFSGVRCAVLKTYADSQKKNKSTGRLGLPVSLIGELLMGNSAYIRQLVILSMYIGMLFVLKCE